MPQTAHRLPCRRLLGAALGLLAQHCTLIVGEAVHAQRHQQLRAAASAGQRQTPFIVSFRVRISGDEDNAEVAAEVAKQINTPGSPFAGFFPWSVARVENATFPPVQLPGATTAPPMLAAVAAPSPGPGPSPPPPPAPAPAPAPGEEDPMAIWRPSGPSPSPASGPAPAPAPGVEDVAMRLDKVSRSVSDAALTAKKLSMENAVALQRLRDRILAAARARQEALAFGLRGEGLPPLWYPTTSMKPEEPPPPSLARLVYDAVVNTPEPFPLPWQAQQLEPAPQAR